MYPDSKNFHDFSSNLEILDFRFLRLKPSHSRQVTSSEIEIACQVCDGWHLCVAVVAVTVVTFGVTFIQVRSACLLANSLSTPMT